MEVRVAGGLRWILGVGVALGAALLLAGCNPDRTFTVNSTADAIDANPGDGSCDDGAGNCTLRAAIMEANASGGLTQISLPPGTYTLSVAGAGEDDSASGDLDIHERIWLFGNNATIDAAGIDRAVQLHDQATILSGVTITGGNDTDAGGIEINGGTLNLSNSTVDANTSSSGAGGIRLDGGDATITGSTVSNNTGYAAGGIQVVDGNLTVENATISGNTATGGEGGGLSQDGGSATIRYSTITDNTGGGVHATPVPGEPTSTTTPVTAPPVGDGTTLTASVIADQNSGSDCAFGAPVSLGYNLDSDDTCWLASPGDLSSEEPLLAPLADNGGPTFTHLPIYGSPVYDHIPSGSGRCNNPTNRDQRGEVRPQGSACEIGSLEEDATIIRTSSTADMNDADPGDGACATSTGACTLRAAVSEANATPESSTIQLQTGATYPLTIPGANEDANATGDLDVTAPLTIIGADATIDANQLDRVFEAAQSLSISDSTITGGEVLSTTGDSPAGGGIYTGAPLTLIRVVVSENRVEDDAQTSGQAAGGGVLSVSPTFVLDQSTIRDNEVIGRPDGPFSNGGGVSAAMVTVTGSTIEANTVTGFGSGGGINVAFDITMTASTVQSNTVVADDPALAVGGGLSAFGGGTVTNTAFVDNEATTTGADGYGGGVAGTDLDITDSEIRQNRSDHGGGLKVDGGTFAFEPVNLSRTTIAGNTATREGGGVFAINTAPGEAFTVVRLDGSVVADNQAAVGGGGYATGGDALLMVVNSTVSGNEALFDPAAGPHAGSGGGLAVGPSELATGSGTISTAYATVTANDADVSSGGIFRAAGEVDLLSTVVGNQVTGSDCGGSPWVASTHGHNLDSDGTCGLTDPTDQPGVYPVLGPLADNGGPTLTHLPLAGSPLFDHIPAGTNGCGGPDLNTDQRGQVRPQGAGCEIGAVETLEPLAPPVPLDMGGAHNFLGAGNDPPDNLPAAAHENFWLAVSGPCASKENGDAVSAITDATYTDVGNPGPVGSSISWVGCTGGSTIANVDHDPGGYFYAVHVPEEYAGGALAVEIFDAPQCSGQNADGSSTNFPASQTGDGVDAGLSGNAANHSTRYRMRDADASPSEPTDNPLLVTTTFTMNQNAGACGGSADDWQNRWRVLHTLIDPVPGATYFVQVDSFDSSLNAAERHQSNSFALRANLGGGTFEPCTGDPTTVLTGVPYLVSCPSVAAPGSASVLANLSNGQSSLSLARVGSEHDGRTLELRIWDPGEGARAIEVIDPNGVKAAFDWEIVNGSGADAPPTGGWTGSAASFTAAGFSIFGLNTLGNDPLGNCQGWNSQPGVRRLGRSIYNDRLVVLRVPLPEDIETAYRGSTTWRTRYTTGGLGCATADRTTWSARIID